MHVNRSLTRRAAAGAVGLALLGLVGCRPGGGNPGTTTTIPTPAGVTKLVQPAPGYNVYRPTNLDTARKLPVIAWANGGCYKSSFTWELLFQRWALAGNLVIAIDAGPTGNPLTQSTAADQGRAIDWAAAQNATGPLAGRVDLTKVVAAGNSCGGITALELASKDARVTSVFVLSGSSSFPGAPIATSKAVMDKVEVPVGFVVGGPEDLARANANRDIDLLGAGYPGYVAQRATADHVTLSTTPAILREVAEIGANWIEFSLYGTASARATLTGNPCGSTCPAGTYTVRTKSFG
jgi:hypothetical protein